MNEVYIVGAARSAIGSFGGSLSKMPASEIAVKVIVGLLQNLKLSPDTIGEVILGQVLTAAVGQNPARQASILAKIPFTVPAMTINKVCGSGLKSVALGYQAITLGESSLIITGGQENMSMAPHALLNSRIGHKMGDWALKDTMIVDGLWDYFNNYHMGQTAENIATKFNISRED